MFLSDFPQEIIIKLTDYLSIKDKASCSLVCKSWTKVFQDSMHSDLFVKSKDDLHNIFSSSQDNQQTYRKTGHIVRYLYIGKDVLVTEKEFRAMQNTLPNIKYLHLETDSLGPVNLGTMTGWSHWSLLRELYISLGSLVLPNANNIFLQIILRAPLLRRLDISDKYTRMLLSFSLNDLENIHSQLTHLIHLGLCSDLLTLSDVDLERITKVSPAPKMDSFSITSKTTDYRWLCYFARKYPNLRTLDLCTSNHEAGIEERIKDAISLFHALPLPFQHLRKLNIVYTDCFESERLFFWDMIQPHNIPLQHISICIDITDNFLDLFSSLYNAPKSITEICLSRFSKTIETFSLECNKKYSTPINLIEMKDSLYNLVKLTINILTTSFELDTLLKSMPRLKEISLFSAHIQVKERLYSSKRFKLQLFQITLSKITSDVLRFLSFHCRSLKVMNLIDIIVYGNFSVPGCQFIDITYSRLNELNIKRTCFIIKDNKECPENLNISLVTRPFDDIPPKQDYDPNVLPTVSGVPIKAHYHWFYRNSSSIMKGISRARGSRIEKYISNYEQNKIVTIDRAACSKRKKPRVNWNNHCVFGYTKIKLGYVADCNIEIA